MTQVPTIYETVRSSVALQCAAVCGVGLLRCVALHCARALCACIPGWCIRQCSIHSSLCLSFFFEKRTLDICVLLDCTPQTARSLGSWLIHRRRRDWFLNWHSHIVIIYPSCSLFGYQGRRLQRGCCREARRSWCVHDSSRDPGWVWIRCITPACRRAMVRIRLMVKSYIYSKSF